MRKSEEKETREKSAVRIWRPPSVELFYAGLGSPNIDSELMYNAQLLEEAQERRMLHENFTTLFSQMADCHMELDEAIASGIVHSSNVESLYDQLHKFMKGDENNDRILLYLPTQFLPDMRDEVNQSSSLLDVKATLAETIFTSWIRLLYESEVRASFIDGDVLEDGMGTPERIRKAAHLMPFLLEKKILFPEDIMAVINMSEDPELNRSLAEGIVASFDRDVFSSDEWENLLSSKCQVNINELLEKKRGNEDFEEGEGKGFEEYVDELSQVIAAIDQEYKDNPQNVSKERIAWEKGVRKDKAIDRYVTKVVDAFIDGRVNIHEVAEQLPQLRDDYARILLVRGLFRYGMSEEIAMSSEELEQFLEKPLMSVKDSVNIRDDIVTGLSHLKGKGQISDKLLDEFGINIPDFSSPFPFTLDDLKNKELEHVSNFVQGIANDPVLSQRLFPAAVVFGSRMKGYAAENSDSDSAIFVRPTTTFSERDEVMERMKILAEKFGLSKVLEFWVTEKEGVYGYKPVHIADRKLVDANQIHFLLGGAWVGEGEEVKTLMRDTVEHYLQLRGHGRDHEAYRLQLLGQLELDIIQYRLMHKGYRKYFPNEREEGTPHASAIDWESDYWDPGFRRVATQLFLSRVFLPDLSQN